MNRFNNLIRGKCVGAGFRGFTLIEALTALAIFLILAAGLISIYFMTVKTWYEGSAQVTLQRKLAIAMERMVRGQRSGTEDRMYGLLEADQITVLDPQTVEFTNGADGTKRRFYLDGNELKYGAGDTDNEEGVAIYDPSRREEASDRSTYRTNINFTQLDSGSVRIQLIGERRLGSQWLNAAIVTTVAPRN